MNPNDITSQFVGRTVDWEKLKRCAHKNTTLPEKGDQYIIYSCGFLYNPSLVEQFGVTPKLKDLWERRGIDFNVYVYVKNEVIQFCDIDKYRESSDARASVYYLKETPQELRVARRILEFIAK